METKDFGAYRIFPKLVKGGVHISTIEKFEEGNTKNHYFLIYSLVDNKIEWLIYNPFKELGFQAVEYDYYHNKIFAYSQNGLKQLSYYDCNEKRRGLYRYRIRI